MLGLRYIIPLPFKISSFDLVRIMRKAWRRSRKVEFLEKWMKGVGKCRSLKRRMNFVERKKVIKVSADIAMASTRRGTRCWSRALLSKACKAKDHTTNLLTNHILGTKSINHIHCRGGNMFKLKKISRGRRRREVVVVKKDVGPSSDGGRMDDEDLDGIGRRTRLLKRLVPGGELMDDACLVEETLDYIQSLRAQVQVMRSLLLTSKSHLIKLS
ncbi:transcription factor IBH1-like 1 [Senna tora]|uniref:Transcription factor IBH1-like 1 n=1 Tax=Senna tora TaxID=362788 RepID=A0A835CCM4_9FABA|nr:transcription factor IBH1-like 1 [Senna tora]